MLNLNCCVNKLNIAKAFYFLFLISLFFPIRYVFPTKDAFQTGAYSDFTSISLYLSDIFLFLTVLFLFLPRGGEFSPRGRIPYHVVRTSQILIIWLILDLIWHFNSLSEINWWFSLKYAELIVAYGTTYYLFTETQIKAWFFKLFLFISCFESVLALWQFKVQGSLGLGKIGEQIISPIILGVAKIVSSGTSYVRGYGTFPHPNLLSAFLAIAVIISAYFLIKSETRLKKTLYSLSLFINTLGLTVTFSRAGILAALLGILVLVVFWVLDKVKNKEKSIFPLIIVLTVSCATSLYIFKPFILTRATVSDQASLERIFYAKTAWKMIEHQPIFGVGIGESVIHMQQYTNIKLWPWQIQPVHNYFLLAMAELGVVGVCIFIWIFYLNLLVVIKSQAELKPLILAVFFAIIILMQFDHYFYTLQQTQMLLWVFLGIASAQLKTPHEGESAKTYNL